MADGIWFFFSASESKVWIGSYGQLRNAKPTDSPRSPFCVAKLEQLSGSWMRDVQYQHSVVGKTG